MIFLTQEDELKVSQLLFAIYFYANWEPTHKKNILMIEKIEKAHKINFFAIDADYFNGLYRRFKVKSIPTIIIFNNGTEKCRINKITTLNFEDILLNKGEIK